MPLTTDQVEQWIYTTTGKRADLYQQLFEPSHPSEREAAFLEISQLLDGAIEEVRVLSAQLREESQAARQRSADLVAESTHLLDKYTASTESQIFRLFHMGPRSGDNGGDGRARSAL
jgi:hypothetical protein